MSHFQQLLSLEPSFYNYEWDFKQGKKELIISFPKNIDEIAQAKYHKGEYIEASANSFQERVQSPII
jgi:hypothetical protein